METNSNASFVSNFWQKNKVVFKGFLIAFLVLLLLIPTSFISDLVYERKARQEESIQEISSKWAGNQTLSGPVLAVPYLNTERDEKGNIIQVREMAYFLPDQLNIESSVDPQERKRGIYKVILYTAKIKMKGRFGKPDLPALKVPPTDYLWNEASLLFDISDVRGIEDELIMKFGEQSLKLEPGRFVTDQFRSALGSSVKIDAADSLSKDFNLEFNLRGSGQLLVVPAGKTTTVRMHSSWGNPSFTGNYLPGTRNVSEKGFDANWKVLYLNRNFPQQWTGTSHKIDEAAFGTDFLQPVDVYQKATRSVKYALLCIVLTFTAFLLIELVYSRALHPFHYVLVGFALCIFYTLLLSISEYIAFNLAYLLATIATVALVTIFVRSILGSSRIAGFVALILSMMYGFIFILIQSQDYALLMGSIGLFLTLALVMYFSRKAKLT